MLSRRLYRTCRSGMSEMSEVPRIRSWRQWSPCGRRFPGLRIQHSQLLSTLKLTSHLNFNLPSRLPLPQSALFFSSSVGTNLSLYHIHSSSFHSLATQMRALTHIQRGYIQPPHPHFLPNSWMKSFHSGPSGGLAFAGVWELCISVCSIKCMGMVNFYHRSNLRVVKT